MKVSEEDVPELQLLMKESFAHEYDREERRFRLWKYYSYSNGSKWNEETSEGKFIFVNEAWGLNKLMIYAANLKYRKYATNFVEEERCVCLLRG